MGSVFSKSFLAVNAQAVGIELEYSAPNAAGEVEINFEEQQSPLYLVVYLEDSPDSFTEYSETAVDDPSSGQTMFTVPGWEDFYGGDKATYYFALLSQEDHDEYMDDAIVKTVEAVDEKHYTI